MLLDIDEGQCCGVQRGSCQARTLLIMTGWSSWVNGVWSWQTEVHVEEMEKIKCRAESDGLLHLV